MIFFCNFLWIFISKEWNHSKYFIPNYFQIDFLFCLFPLRFSAYTVFQSLKKQFKWRSACILHMATVGFPSFPFGINAQENCFLLKFILATESASAWFSTSYVSILKPISESGNGFGNPSPPIWAMAVVFCFWFLSYKIYPRESPVV